jgi:hypothetical protein
MKNLQSLLPLSLLLVGAPLASQPSPSALKVIAKSQNEIVWHWCPMGKAQRVLTLSLYLDGKLIKNFLIPIRRDRRGNGVDSTPIKDDEFDFTLDNSRPRETYGHRHGNIWPCASESIGLLIGIMAWRTEDTGSKDSRTINDRMWVPVDKSASIDLGDGVKMVTKIKGIK